MTLGPPLALWLLMAPQFISLGNRITSDSAAYIDCARSIRAGHGLQTRVNRGLGEPSWQPLTLWPPGYPLLVAGAMAAGLNPYSAALAVAVVCSTLFVIVVTSMFATRLSTPVAAAAGIALVSMRPLLDAGTMCWSEGPFMLLMAVSLACLAKGTAGPGPTTGWLLLAGVTAGLSWCVRNVAVALAVASLCYLGITCIRPRLAGIIPALAVWLGGWALGGGWLVALNMAIFGTASPYRMPPSESSLLKNVRDAVLIASRDLLLPGLRGEHLAVLGLSPGLLAVVAALVAAAILVSLIAKGRRPIRWITRFFAESPGRFLLVLFLGGYVLTVVVARSVYRWGEDINSRHFAPVYWIVLLLVAMACERLADRDARTRAWSRPLLIGGIVLMAALQIRASLVAVGKAAVTTSGEIRSLAEQLGRDVPAGRIVLTDAAPALRVFGDIAARHPTRIRDPEPTLTLEDIMQAATADRLWGIVIAEGGPFAAGDFGAALRDAARGGLPGFHRRDGGRAVQILQYAGEDAGRSP